MPGVMQKFNGYIATAIAASLGAIINPSSGFNEAVQQSNIITFYVRFGSGTSGGTFVVQVAPDLEADGTTSTAADEWATVATIAWSAASKWETATISSGPHQRVRIKQSVALVGGTADIYCRASVIP